MRDTALDVCSMRQIDRRLGVPLCFLLTRLRNVLAPLRRRADGPPNRIAFIKLAEQGATVLAYPAIREAAEMVGTENVFFLVFENNRPLLDLMEIIPRNNIIAIRTERTLQTCVDALRAVWRMRRAKIDAVIDLEFFARSSAAMAFLSGARVRVGFHGFVGETPYRGDLMTHRLSFNPFLHASQLFRMEVAAVRAQRQDLPAFDLRPSPDSDRMCVFEPPRLELLTVRKKLREQMKDSCAQPLILLNANCSDLLPLRKWPEERYVELARRLLAQYPEVHIAFTGAPSERREIADLVSTVASNRCCSMAGQTTLGELLVLYCLAEVLVTNDSGPAHFARLTPIDVVTLFGPETPAVFGVNSPRSHVLWARLVCSPCVNAYNNRLSACKNNICMQRISVEQVFNTVCEVYERRRSQA